MQCQLIGSNDMELGYGFGSALKPGLLVKPVKHHSVLEAGITLYKCVVICIKHKYNQGYEQGAFYKNS